MDLKPRLRRWLGLDDDYKMLCVLAAHVASMEKNLKVLTAFYAEGTLPERPGEAIDRDPHTRM